MSKVESGCPYADKCAVPNTSWGNVGGDHPVCFKVTANKAAGCTRALTADGAMTHASGARESMRVAINRLPDSTLAAKVLGDYLRTSTSYLEALLSSPINTIEEMATTREAAFNHLQTMEEMCRMLLNTPIDETSRQSQLLEEFFRRIRNNLDNSIRYSLISPAPADNSEIERWFLVENGGHNRETVERTNPMLRALAIFAHCSLLDIPAEIYQQHPSGDRMPIRAREPGNGSIEPSVLIRLIITDQRLFVEMDGQLPENLDW